MSPAVIILIVAVMVAVLVLLFYTRRSPSRPPAEIASLQLAEGREA